MKKITYCFLVLSAIVFTSCGVNESVKIDLTTGLSSKGSGLSCDDVYLTMDDEKINRNEFIFGEAFEINFNNIEGFKLVSGGVFPGMELLIMDKQGDTVLYNPDLYADLTKPTTVTPLLLNTTITIGNPFRSNRSYIATVHIWDKKGKGTFDTKFEFSTLPNKSIKITNDGLTADEIYLYDQDADAVVSSNTINTDHKVGLVFHEPTGFKTENNLCKLGLSMVIRDKNGELLLSEDDLLMDQTMDATMTDKQVFGSFRLPKGAKGPIRLEVILWDKIGNGKITAKAELELE